jgi:hypothetical protein
VLFLIKPFYVGLIIRGKGRDPGHKGAKIFINIRTIPIIYGMYQEIPTFRKRESERKIGKTCEVSFELS